MPDAIAQALAILIYVIAASIALVVLSAILISVIKRERK